MPLRAATSLSNIGKCGRRRREVRRVPRDALRHAEFVDVPVEEVVVDPRCAAAAQGQRRRTLADVYTSQRGTASSNTVSINRVVVAKSDNSDVVPGSRRHRCA